MLIYFAKDEAQFCPSVCVSELYVRVREKVVLLH